VKIEGEFRTDFIELFRLYTFIIKITHAQSSPFIVVTPKKMEMFTHVTTLINSKYNKNTVVLQSWPGSYKTDCFVFTLGDLRDYASIHSW